MDCEARKAQTLARTGFLALKTEQYAQFPSIRKMSDDWHQIALIAADAYNALASDDCIPREVAVQAREAILAARRTGTFDTGQTKTLLAIALTALDKALEGNA